MGQNIGQANHYGDITKHRMDVSRSAGEQARGIESILATASVGGTACAISATVGWWTSSANTASASANTDEMNQLCRVCGEPAAGFHFGAFTCEGCKSFFGRTYNNVGSISECKNGGVCVINKKNRTACKACRLRKCLIVGMSKSGSRYGRRSNWFKIHCLLQEQSHQAQTRFIKDPKSAYEKTFSVLDAANNNNNNNNNETPSTTSASSVVSMVTTATTTANSYHHHHHHHHLYSHYSAEEKASKREDPTILRSHDNPLQLRLQDSTPERTSCETVFRSAELARSPHELLRPEASRFPMWRGPPFLHPALTHMQLLNAPFFPFQQRFIMPYVNQVGGAQLMASLSASSSESVSPRSTPSLKDEGENRESRDEERCQVERGCEVDKDCQRPSAGAEVGYDKSLAYLKSLGPEQEEPIDLSMKNPMTRPARADVGSTEGEEGDEEEEEEAEGEERSTDTENDELPQDTGPPLDLTRKT